MERFPLPKELAGTKVLVKDRWGTERAAPLFFVSPNQINYQIPPSTDWGPVTVTVTSGDGAVSVGTAQISRVAPGLFTANNDGNGVPKAEVWQVKADGKISFWPVFQYDSEKRRFVHRPIDLGEETDKVYLVLYGTGLRHHNGLSSVSLKIGGTEVPVIWANYALGYYGLDQVNAHLPRSLIGRGEVDVALVVEGKTANTVRINIR